MWIEIDEKSLENFKYLVPAEELYRIGKDEDYIGIAYTKSNNKLPLAAILFKPDMEEDEEGEYPIIDIRYFAVAEEARMNGVFTGLFKEFLELTEDDFIGLIRADIPMDSEYDVACKVLEDFGFEFVPAEQYEFTENLSKCRKYPLLAAKDKVTGIAALSSLTPGGFKEIISGLLRSGKLNDENEISANIAEYDPDISAVMSCDGKTKALVLVKGPYGDMLDVVYAGGEGEDEDVFAVLRECMRLAAAKYSWSYRVHVKIRTDEGAALLMKLFPDARPVPVRRGYLYPEME